ncbi:MULTISPECIES: hypothetical protein [Chryseobacterium]|jgi:hypothetical protein|uniref:Lipoprotein n=1 Tax=Chryseobacterium geocarposphaerae TaxID=1416776 RepID=A0ABU1LG70_9FLAO|nr:MULTISPECIES: hypothetical protein [Chryseobacterium]MDR6405728.1 hypothetical protein [Chryseobacterium geocarposphaerae]MDR6699110.1 hypothetical protein [Chryseobacterium ginsenosidimutans]
MKNVIKFSMICMTLFLVSCNKEKTIDDELKEAAANMNKLTPQILNDGVRLDSVSALPNKVFKYNYTLTDDVKESVTPQEIETFKSQAKEGAIRVVKTSADMQEFRDNDVTLQYSYFDKNGKPTADFIIKPEEYKSK